MSRAHTCLGLLLAACMAPALGQAPPGLAEAVEAAWRRASPAADTAGQLQRAQAERAAASALWAAPPAVEVGAARDRQRATGTSRETELGLALPLWLPSQRAARMGQADAAQQAATAAAAAARLRVAGAVREAAAEVALQRADLAAAQAQMEELQALARDVDRRVAAGDLARADALAAHAEHLAAGKLLAQSRQRLQAAELHWQALTGLKEVPSLPAETLPPTPTAQPVPPALQAHPALRAAELQAEAARQRLNVVQASRRDAPELSLRARQELAPGEPRTQGVGVALRIPLGAADRNAPLLAAALSELALAQAMQRELQQQLEAEHEVARLAQASARQQLADERARARLLRERSSLIEMSFKAGETALPEMLRALTAATQAQAAVARAEAALAQATARLQQAQGAMP